MDKVVVKFFNYGTWSNEQNEPAFHVGPNEHREVTRSFAKYICAINQGKIIHDPREHRSIPKVPTINDLNLHPVTLKRLENHGVSDIDTLCKMKNWQILAIEGIGIAKLNEIETKLRSVNLRLADPV